MYDNLLKSTYLLLFLALQKLSFRSQLGNVHGLRGQLPARGTQTKETVTTRQNNHSHYPLQHKASCFAVQLKNVRFPCTSQHNIERPSRVQRQSIILPLGFD